MPPGHDVAPSVAGATCNNPEAVEVETAGIEPASAVAPDVTSTSVSGALFSPHARLAGGVAWGQLPEDVPGSAGADLPG